MSHQTPSTIPRTTSSSRLVDGGLRWNGQRPRKTGVSRSCLLINALPFDNLSRAHAAAAAAVEWPTKRDLFSRRRRLRRRSIHAEKSSPASIPGGQVVVTSRGMDGPAGRPGGAPRSTVVMTCHHAASHPAHPVCSPSTDVTPDIALSVRARDSAVDKRAFGSVFDVLQLNRGSRR